MLAEISKEREFIGFSKKTIEFFEELARNNNKEWFEKNRSRYEAHVMEPAKAFVVALGARLRRALPNIVSVPKVNKSIFRLNRDTRFSLNKSPYKTNLGIYFWEGTLSRMDCPGFYFHLQPPKMLLGAGMYMIPDRLLERYRRAVVHPKLGKELSKMMRALSKVKGTELGGKYYKRIPAGYDPHHPNAELLLYNGLHFGQETTIPKEFYSGALIGYCFERLEPFFPLHRWLVAVIVQRL